MAARVGVDKWLFFTTLLLVLVGLLMVFSASAVVAQERFNSPYQYVGRQALWALAGVLAMVVLMQVDSNVYKSSRFIYFASCVTTILLVSVFFFPNSHNTHRWIRFGSFFTFQPSELAKPMTVLFLAWFLHTRLDQMRDWKNTLLKAGIMPVVFMLLIVKEPDLGTALVVAGVTALMLILAGMEWKYLGMAAGVALPGLAALLLLVSWRLKRVLVFLNPEADPQGAGFHINQSLIAVGTGGLTGLPRPGPLRAPGSFRHHSYHRASGLFQHQRRAVTGPHQGNSAPAHLFRRHLGIRNPGQHRHSPQHHSKSLLRRAGIRAVFREKLLKGRQDHVQPTNP